jgi:hypothetical protein
MRRAYGRNIAACSGPSSGGCVMTELLMSIQALIVGPGNCLWLPRVYTAAMADDLWEAWIEFTPLGADERSNATPRLRLAPATRQATRDDILDWARGITYPYLGGVLLRTIEQNDHAA